MAKFPTIENALHELVPGARWGIVEGVLEWQSEDIEQPSQEEIDNKILELKQLWDDEHYARTRKSLYPPIVDQLDMIYWDMVNGTENWKNTITNIKNTYPKGVNNE